MRVMMQVEFPHEKFNALVREGTVDAKLKRIMDEMKPEAAYFLTTGGRRKGLLFVNMTDSAQIPALAEPWFLTFDADVTFYPVMVPADVAKAGLDALGKKWG